MSKKPLKDTSNSRRQFTDQFKANAVKILLDGHSASSIVDRLGLTVTNLNHIERVWKFVKAVALSAQVLPDFESFRTSIESTLLELSTTHRGQMKTLVTRNFQLFDNAHVLACCGIESRDERTMASDKGRGRAGRIPELDALRGLAAVYVVLHHYLEIYPRKIRDTGCLSFDLPVSGQFAVHLFFIISGFVIFMTLERSTSVMHFVKSRSFRLFPTYWSAIFATSLIVFLLPIAGDESSSAAKIVMNMTMLHNYFGITSVDSVYWSLGVELAFYVWMGALLALGKLKQVSFLSWIWLAVCLIAFLFQDYSNGYPIPSGSSFGYALDSGLLLRFAPLFIAGIAFYRLRMETTTRGHHLLILASFLVYVTVCIYPGLAIGLRTIVPAVGIYACFYLLSYGWLRPLAIKPLVFLGTISYALYVTHSVAGNHFRHWLHSNYKISDTIALPLTIVFAFLLATSITFLIEKPIAKLLRSKDRSQNDETKDKNGLIVPAV
jgi:peptidoglycan/LPS O-acetylase OafA/YrhL